MIDRRRWSAAVLGTLALPAPAQADATPGDNILRVPFGVAETGFDGVRVGDLYSRNVVAHIFEALYHYDPLASPVKVRPLTAAALPTVSADFRTWTIPLQRGVFFADDPAFKGRPRELVAGDYVYALKRFFDPSTKAPHYSTLAEEGIVGLEEVRAAALKARRPFDYDAPVEGLRALDRYTLQVRLASPRPRFLAKLCDSSQTGAVAREVVEAYGDDIVAHPVGTGPYRLKEWRRGSRIVLERNPGFRDVRFDAEPAADDAQGQAWLARFKGRRLPFNDGVEISVMQEDQARWLSFLNGQIDYLRVPLPFGDLAAPGGTLAPNLARRGIGMRRYVNADFTMSWFNMEDAVVGGYTADKVALRRAIGLAYDIEREVRLLRRGQAVPAQAAMVPGTFGHDPHYRSDQSSFDPPRAKALLDLYGYLDRDGDGFREQPDGSPLGLVLSCENSQSDRQFNEVWQKSMAAVGLRMTFRVAQWPENLRSARAGSLQMWLLADTAESPDALGSIEYMYGPASGDANVARFRLPAFDALYRRLQSLPDTPERAALFPQAANLVAAYMPYRIHVHRVYTDLHQPWIAGWRQPSFSNEQWMYVEVDAARRARGSRST